MTLKGRLVEAFTGRSPDDRIRDASADAGAASDVLSTGKVGSHWLTRRPASLGEQIDAGEDLAKARGKIGKAKEEKDSRLF